MTIDEELWGDVWNASSEKGYREGLDNAGLKGLHYFIKFYLARGKSRQYEAWLDYLRSDRELPQEIRKAASRLFLKGEQI